MKKIFNAKIYYIITFLVICLLVFMSVGYARYGQILNLSGISTMKPDGKFRISNVTYDSGTYVNTTPNPTHTDDSVDFDLTFRSTSNNTVTATAVYTITLTNESSYKHTITDLDFSFTITKTSTGGGNTPPTISSTITGVSPGDELLPSETVSFQVNITARIGRGTYSTDGETTLESDSTLVGNVYATLGSDRDVDLENNSYDYVPITVINTYNTDKTYTIITDNTLFDIVDSSGNAFGTRTILAGDTQTVNVYVKLKQGASYTYSTEALNLILQSSGLADYNIGSITALLPGGIVLTDTDAPYISNVTITKETTVGDITISWTGEDDSAISNYTILLYKTDNTLYDTYNTTSTSYQISNLPDGDFYAKVYATDSYNNTATSTEIANATTDRGHCSKSSDTALYWYLTVTYNLSNISSNGTTQVLRGGTVTATLSTSGWYTLPNSITVSMGGVNLNSNQYTYNSSDGSLSIPNVTGNVVVTGTASGCLIEGTEILLSNGKYKKIEDITYNDLLKVWNYDTGSITYQYPIWIEKEKRTNTYRSITFSDGTILNVYGYHGLFSVDLNRFVSVDNPLEFNIGTTVYKVVNNKLVKVKVTNIEVKNEEVNYYHVVSTRYYNIIANDILTTDGTVVLSNLFGFNSDVTWSLRDTIISDKNNLYKYDDLKDALPYYMFVGLRAEEGKFLEKYGIDLNTFKYYLKSNQTNENLWLKPYTKDNKNIWKVSIGINGKVVKEDIVTEGSFYKLPNNYGIKYYNTSDSKYYNGGDYVRIYHGTYFEEVL